MVLIIIGVLVVTELLALAWLASTVPSYKSYWLNKATGRGDITYVALGDSAAQGIGATSPERGYVGLIARRITDKTGKTVTIKNLSKTGAKISDYLADQAPQVAALNADIVTLEIGANDVATLEPDSFRRQFRQVLATLPDGAFVSNMPVFNSRFSSSSKAKVASTIIAEELAAYPRLHFVDLQKQTTENQSIFGFAPDFFHPNNLSYKHWADAFWIPMEQRIDIE